MAVRRCRPSGCPAAIFEVELGDRARVGRAAEKRGEPPPEVVPLCGTGSRLEPDPERGARRVVLARSRPCRDLSNGWLARPHRAVLQARGSDFEPPRNELCAGAADRCGLPPVFEENVAGRQPARFRSFDARHLPEWQQVRRRSGSPHAGPSAIRAELARDVAGVRPNEKSPVHHIPRCLQRYTCGLMAPVPRRVLNSLVMSTQHVSMKCAASMKRI